MMVLDSNIPNITVRFNITLVDYKLKLNKIYNAGINVNEFKRTHPETIAVKENINTL